MRYTTLGVPRVVVLWPCWTAMSVLELAVTMGYLPNLRPILKSWVDGSITVSKNTFLVGMIRGFRCTGSGNTVHQHSMMRLNRWLKGTCQGNIGNLGFSPPVNVRIRLCFPVDLPIIQCLGLKSAPLLHNVHRDIFTWFGGMNWSLQDRQKERPSGGKMSKILKPQFLKPTKTVTTCIKMLQQIAAWRLFPPLNTGCPGSRPNQGGRHHSLLCLVASIWQLKGAVSQTSGSGFRMFQPHPWKDLLMIVWCYI